MILCYRDANGYCRVDPNDMHPLIGSYLEQDVQGDLASCHELNSIIDEMMCGNRTEWHGTGNAHTVKIGSYKVTIENEMDDGLGVAELSLQDFRECIQAWETCISQ